MSGRSALLATLVLACGAQAPGSRPAQGQAVAAGHAFTCALRAGGEAYCWGLNEGGQLGSGTAVGQSAVPVPVAGGLRFRDLSAGWEHACAVAQDGRAYCWGFSPEGALGVAQEVARTPVAVATDVRFVRISAGDQRTCALTADGRVFCWGRFSLPSADPAGRGGPDVTAVTALARFRSVGASLSKACAIAEDGRLYCWGKNREGELGLGPDRRAPYVELAPLRLDERMADLSVSANVTCVVTDGGKAYCWGRNAFGQLGNGSASADPNETTPAPTPVAGGQRWQRISTSGAHTCALTTDGAAYCWGANFPRPLLGTPTVTERCGVRPARECSTRPLPVHTDVRFRQISVGSHACGVSTQGAVYCWGDNSSGQLGNGTVRPSITPTAVVEPGSVPERPSRRPPELQLSPINPPALPGRVRPPPAPAGGDALIQITLYGAVAEAVIVDPLGRRLGIDPASGAQYAEPPDASYDSTGLGTLRNDSLVGEDALWKEIYFNAPADGEYTVWVIGTRAGRYTLSVGGYDVSRRSSWFTPKDVPVTPGERHEYRFRFSAADAGRSGLGGRRIPAPNR